MTMTPAEFTANCIDLIDSVQKQGGELVISKNGSPAARLVVVGNGRPWVSLRGKGRFVGDPFPPVVTEKEIQALA